MTREIGSASAIDWVKRLISVDTTSRDSNLPLLAQVTELLDARGVSYVTIPNAEGTKANLIATFPAADGTTTGGVVLSGHTDVVPVDGQDWHTDPFEVVEKDGRLYGRGTTDMKGFIAVVLSRVDAILARELSEPIHLAFSYDEEIGCVGAVSIMDEFTSRGTLPRACIVGEPTSMRVVRGHKSMNVVRVDFHGVAAHSSRTPDGVNTIDYASELIVFARSLASDFIATGARDDAYDVPFTTVSVNIIDGGTALNIIPADCAVTFEFRSIAADAPAPIMDRFRAEVARIDAEMKSHSADASATLSILAASPGLETAEDAAVIDFAISCGGLPGDAKVAYGTEAGLFHTAGIPTVVCGPGSMEQGHTPNEYIELEQITRCEEFIDSLIDHLSV